MGATALLATGVGAGAAFGMYTLAASTSVAVGATAAVTGTAALVLDAGACRDGDRKACAGATMGAAGVIFGTAGLAADGMALMAGGYTETTELLSGAGAVGGLMFGGIGLTIDLSSSCE